MNIEDKRKMFALRNRMTQIPYNYGKKEEKCVCGTVETMQHIYSCESLNSKKTNLDYNLVYNGNLNTQVEIFRRFEDNLEKRKKFPRMANATHKSDPQKRCRLTNHLFRSPKVFRKSSCFKIPECGAGTFCGQILR